MAKAMQEKDETPEVEAKSHSPRFLKRAAKLAAGKREGKRGPHSRAKGRM